MTLEEIKALHSQLRAYSEYCINVHNHCMMHEEKDHTLDDDTLVDAFIGYLIREEK